jgi:hypothetical protein
MNVEMGQDSPGVGEKSTSEKPNQFIIMRVWLYLIRMGKRDLRSRWCNGVAVLAGKSLVVEMLQGLNSNQTSASDKNGGEA